MCTLARYECDVYGSDALACMWSTCADKTGCLGRFSRPMVRVDAVRAGGASLAHKDVHVFARAHTHTHTHTHTTHTHTGTQA